MTTPSDNDRKLAEEYCRKKYDGYGYIQWHNYMEHGTECYIAGLAKRDEQYDGLYQAVKEYLIAEPGQPSEVKYNKLVRVFKTIHARR